MQTTRTRRGSSFQERDSEGRFANRSRGNGNVYENDYYSDRFGNRGSRYDEDDFDERRGYGRSSRYQDDDNYDDDYYTRNRAGRAYDDSAEYDDEDYEVDRYEEDEDEDYGTRGYYDRNERWGRSDYPTMSRGEYRNQPRGQHQSGWDEGHYGNVSRRRDYNSGVGYDGGSYRTGGNYGNYGSDMRGDSRRNSGRGRGFASMSHEEVQRIGRMGGRVAARSRRGTRSGGSQRSSRSRSRR